MLALFTYSSKWRLQWSCFPEIDIYLALKVAPIHVASEGFSKFARIIFIMGFGCHLPSTLLEDRWENNNVALSTWPLETVWHLVPVCDWCWLIQWQHLGHVQPRWRTETNDSISNPPMNWCARHVQSHSGSVLCIFACVILLWSLMKWGEIGCVWQPFLSFSHSSKIVVRMETHFTGASIVHVRDFCWHSYCRSRSNPSSSLYRYPSCCTPLLAFKGFAPSPKRPVLCHNRFRERRYSRRACLCLETY